MILGLQKKILELLVVVKQQNEEIISIIKNQKTQQHIGLLPDNLPAKLPISNNEDLSRIESFLKDNDNLSSLVSVYKGRIVSRYLGLISQTKNTKNY